MSLDARASALLEQITTDQKTAAREALAETPAEPGATVQAATADEGKPAEAGLTTEPKTQEQLAEERRQRIEARTKQLAEEERQRVADSRARKEGRQAPAAEAPPAQQGVAITDAASFFAAAEKLQIPPQDLAAWLTQQNDPAKAAEAAARKTLSPLEQKLKDIEDRQAALERREAEIREQAQLAQVIEQNHQLLANHIESVKAEAPLAAAFLSNNPKEYRRAVEGICDALPAGFTAQDVVDQLEENLSSLARALQIQSGQATSATKPTAKPAAAKANVGNRLAAERATTVDPSDEDEGGDLEERARKLKARLAAG